ncbi:hypothetical protein [Pediococcus parvulus]
MENLRQTDQVIRGWLKEIRKDVLGELHDPLSVAKKVVAKIL